MLWCQSPQDTGQSDHKLKSALHRMITMHACPTLTDRRTDRRTNIMAIARRFVIIRSAYSLNTVCATPQPILAPIAKEATVNSTYYRSADGLTWSVKKVPTVKPVIDRPWSNANFMYTVSQKKTVPT